MQNSKKLEQRIAELPLGSRDRDQALRNVQTAEEFIDGIVAAVNVVRRAIRALEQFGRSLHRQHKVS